MTWLMLLACQGSSEEAPPTESEPALDSQDSDPVVDPRLGCSEERAGIGSDTCLSEAACVWTGERSREVFGVSLHIGPDVDGDGVQDMLLGSPGWYVFGDSTTNTGAGRVSLVSGASLTGDGGIEAMHEGSELEEYLGSGAMIVGDVDGDGLADMLVGAMGRSPPGLEGAGAAHLILGQDGGWEDGLFTPAETWLGPDPAGRAGWQVGGGDLDGDGLAELWVADGIRDAEDAWDRGQVWLIPGGSVPTGDLEQVATGALVGAGSVDAMGQSIVVGDFDGDGLNDSAFGGPYGASYKGRVWLWPGGRHPEGLVAMAQHDHYVSGETNNDVFGWKLAAGDLDGDGDDELIVGAPLNDQADGAAGKVYVYEGGPGVWTAPELLASFTGEFHDFQLGTGLAAGDLDGDGKDELAIGSVDAWRGLVTRGGRAYVVPGQSSGWQLDQPIVEAASSQLHGVSVKDYAGGSLSIGDLDGDGSSDLAVGSGYVNVDGLYDVGTVYLFFGGM